MWGKQVARLVEHLALTRLPVAVRYERNGAARSDSGVEPNTSACTAFLRASEGRTLRLSATDFSCNLGPYCLGVGPASAASAQEAFETVVLDPERASCFVEGVPEALGPAGRPQSGFGNGLVLSPLDSETAKPDLVVFICTFEQACKLIALDCHPAGGPAPMELRGSTCYRAVTYPMMAGYLNVTLMSNAGRSLHGYRPEDVLVSVPAERFERMLGNLQGLATARLDVDIPEALRTLLEERCQQTNN
jgi:uncharacterized protein (DUF169 family)